MRDIIRTCAEANSLLWDAESKLGQGRATQLLAEAGLTDRGQALLVALAAAEAAVAFARKSLDAVAAEARRLAEPCKPHATAAGAEVTPFHRRLAAAMAEAGPGVCAYCGEPKVDGPACRGNDQCVYGPDGGPALCCTGWSGMCCKCGASYAIGQM